MKKIIFFIVLIPQIIFGQNFEPVQRQFIIPAESANPQYLSSDSSYFQQSKIIKGNHWDNFARLGRVVGYNQMDIYSGINTADLQDSSILFVKLLKNLNQWDTVYFTHCQGPEVFNARGIQYSPVLKIDTTKTYTLQTRSGESTNPIFGFAHIRGRITSNPNDSLYSKLILDGDSLNRQVILEEPWTADQLTFFENNPRIESTEKNYLR